MPYLSERFPDPKSFNDSSAEAQRFLAQLFGSRSTNSRRNLVAIATFFRFLLRPKSAKNSMAVTAF